MKTKPSTHDSTFKHKWRPRARRGVTCMLSAFLLIALVALSAFAVNFAYMMVVRTELMVATDAAARSGGRAMMVYENVDDVLTSIQATAAMNKVAGNSLILSVADAANEIEFGNATIANSGRMSFTKISTNDVRAGAAIADCVRVNGQKQNVPLLVACQSADTFDVAYMSTGSQVERDIILVLDISKSMTDVKSTYRNWNWPSQYPYSYPTAPRGNPHVKAAQVAGRNVNLLRPNRRTWNSGDRKWDEFVIWTWETYDGLGDAPYPWTQLKGAVQAFFDVLNDTRQSEKVGLVTYYDIANIDMLPTTDYTAILTEMHSVTPEGATNIEAGLEKAKEIVTGDQVRSFAAKYIVLLTDGQYNRGGDPSVIAENITASTYVRIFTITFGDLANQSDMQSVASRGNGRHFHADDGTDLQSIFEEIARDIPTIISE